MKSNLIIALTLVAAMLFVTGCSSVISRTKPREAKLYPGVRYSSKASCPGGGGSDQLGELIAYCWLADLALSAGVDTLLLPVDLAYKPAPPVQGPPKYTQGVYRGVYRFGFERSIFTPANSREKWWVSGDIGEVTRRMIRPSFDQPAELQNPVSLVVEGYLSERGHHGHMGGYRRELTVTQVLEVEQLSPPEP